MDFFKKNVNISEAADFAYAEWYANLSDAKKAQFFQSGYDFVVEKVRHDVTSANPFSTEAETIFRFIELTQKDSYPEDKFSFIQKVMHNRSEKEWRKRFKKMKTELGWSYDDIARFIGASGGGSVKASVNRRVPAFGKLAVCVYETLRKREEEG